MLTRFLSLVRPKDDDWTKPLGAVLATVGFLWGAWVFLFQEVLRPAVAPVNISLALEIKRLKPLSEAIGNAQPVLLTASAKNSSKKILTIRKTFWVAHAIALSRAKQNPDNSIQLPNTEEGMIKDINNQMTLGRDMLSLEGTATSSYQSSADKWQVIGFGSLFDVNEIRPDEEIKVQRVVLVPKLASPNDFKLLRVRVMIPSYAKRSNLADEDLIRVVGGISQPSKEFVKVGFCQAERNWRQHGLRWFFDKFALPQDRFDSPVFREPASRYCPTLMTPEQRDRVGAQVFNSTFEIPLDVAAEVEK
jgi:hypothetical protein